MKVSVTWVGEGGVESATKVLRGSGLGADKLPIKGQTVNISSFAAHIVSITTTPHIICK